VANQGAAPSIQGARLIAVNNIGTARETLRMYCRAILKGGYTHQKHDVSFSARRGLNGVALGQSAMTELVKGVEL
jgi:hypothetical protein